ncbi:hypothetical protein L208DRAFT_1381680 [Tricholoma matsutake]|nr:hypothetical protein L208DRAFT_1381680 [Tricholoma matsutake 945]
MAGQKQKVQDENTPLTIVNLLESSIPPPPSVLPIPLHQTEQYPIPAMHIDESSIDGTIGVIHMVLFDTLKLSEEELRKHGVILCGGDQLMVSLTDKASASRRNDSDLQDNISRYTKPRLGLFHCKIAGNRCTANEHWGQLNSMLPWSLWKINSILGCKAISVGWKLGFLKSGIIKLFKMLQAKYSQIYGLGDVLQNFGNLEKEMYLLRILFYLTVMHLLCGNYVLPSNMVILEVLLMFWPIGCHGFLMNWLANLTGKENGFKEMDLLQEHQNIWLKIIYSAKGSNQTWAWLAMISVSIFTLRKVIHNVQLDYRIPHNGMSHTSPSTKDDIEYICSYLEQHILQSDKPECENNKWAEPIHDLLEPIIAKPKILALKMAVYNLLMSWMRMKVLIKISVQMLSWIWVI